MDACLIPLPPVPHYNPEICLSDIIAPPPIFKILDPPLIIIIIRGCGTLAVMILSNQNSDISGTNYQNWSIPCMQLVPSKVKKITLVDSNDRHSILG